MCPLCEDGNFSPIKYCKLCQGTSQFGIELLAKIDHLIYTMSIDENTPPFWEE